MTKFYRYPLAAIATLALAAAGCGGSGQSAKQQASTLAKQQTLPLGPGGAQVAPTTVTCNSSGSDCTLVYPNGEKEDCSISISGSDQSVSCTNKP